MGEGRPRNRPLAARDAEASQGRGIDDLASRDGAEGAPRAEVLFVRDPEVDQRAARLEPGVREPLDRELRAFARRAPGCRALMAHYGIGELTAVTILAELGDARRFSSSRRAVRYAGMDVTVLESDSR